MEPRKRHKKGQVVPDEGKNNSNFVMDEFDEKPTNNRMMPNKFAEVANIVASEGNALKLISNVKATASKWKAYTTSRRVRRRPVHENSVVASGQDGTSHERQAGGLGLDDIHEDFTSVTSFPAGKSSMRKKDLEMGIASNRALIQYFAKLGQSLKDDEVINLEFVHTLIDSGADINCIDRYGQTVLHEVARAWHTDVAQFLIEIGADINKGDHYGRTALHVAAAVDYPEMVNLLIEHGADRESRTKGENQTPVFYAAKTDAVQSLKALIKKGCLYKEEKDFKGRTPIHVAAELDRSETARVLLELQAPVWYADKTGFRAITWMISKMAPVANEALNQFHLTDRPNRKQYFYLNFLCRDKETDPNGRTQTPLHIAVSFRQYDLLMHTVFIRLLETMWLKFGRFWALWNLGLNFLYIVIWTVIGISVDYDKKHSYILPDDGWRIFLFILAAAFTIYQILEEVMDFFRSQRLHREYEIKRTAEIERDIEYCHPRWPEEEIYLQAELGEVEKLKPKYFSDMWNIFDWLCYILLIVCIATHVADVFAHSDFMARFHIRIMAITIILLWLRLMKNARAFALLGPFIVMLGHMLKDCVRFLFLYMEFYIPYLAAFWMLFGGTKKSSDNSDETVTVSGYTYFGQLFFSMLRLTLVDEYDYENMTRIDNVMADLLLATWFFLSAILCLNLFIALLSDTFQRVYDNAQANAVMQKAITIINIWEGISHERRERFLKYIETTCSPLVDTYDDDMTTSGEEDLKKVTIQIKEDLDNFQEMFKLRFGDPQLQFMSSDVGEGRDRKYSNGGSAGGLISVDKFESEVDDLRETVKAVKVQQEEMAVRFRKEMTLVKSMLRQLLGKDSQDDAEKNVYLERSSTPSELTPVSRMRRKKKKQLLTPDTLSETTSEHRQIQPLLDIETTEFSPASIPDLTRSAHPQAFDVMLSSTTPSQPLPNLDEGGSTNC